VNGGVLPPAASSLARDVDPLFWTVTAVIVFFALLVGALVVTFCIRYRRRDAAEAAPQIEGNVLFEAVWTGVPLAIALGLFVWGSRVFVASRRTPPESRQVYVVGKQWMWKFQHPEGQAEIDELHVPAGTAISLLMTSQDVIHSLYVPAFRVKMDVLPGRYTSAWFQATEPGVYTLACTEYCGMSHAAMQGRVIVMEPERYAQWLEEHRPDRPLSRSGEEVFRRFHCDACHGAIDAERGPALAGLLSRSVLLADGTRAEATPDYVRESIVKPGAKLVAGWGNVMPPYEGRLTEEELLQLVEYVRSLPAGEPR
jgi:cytochrome c oxidase subunit II